MINCTFCLILCDIGPLFISYQSGLILLSDKHNCIDLIYLVFIRHYYMFRLSTSAIASTDDLLPFTLDIMQFKVHNFSYK